MQQSFFSRAQRLDKVDSLNEWEFLEESRDQVTFPSTSFESPEMKSYRQQEEKKELQRKITEINALTGEQEALLRLQITDLTEKLQKLENHRQEEMKKHQEMHSNCMDELEMLKENMQRLEQDYSIITKSSKNKQKIKNVSKQAKLKGYQDNVNSLEHRLEKISEEKNNLLKKSENLSKIIEQTKNSIAMTKEELSQRSLIRVELIAENEQTEEMLEVLKETALEHFENQELQDYFEGCKKIKSDQEVIIGKIKQIQNKIDGLRQEKLDFEKFLQSNQAEIDKFYNEIICKSEEKEIENLEQLIKETCENLNLEYLENIILSLNAAENFDLDEEVLKIQLLKVQREEASLKEQWSKEASLMHDTIKNVYSENQELREKLENEFKKKTQKYYNKTAALAQWKSEVIAALNSQKPGPGPVKDRGVFLEFRNLSVAQIENPQSQKSFENIVSLYIEKITSRETLLQENFKKLFKLQSNRENAMRRLKEANTNMMFLEQCKLSEQLHLSNLMCKEKSLILLVKNTDPDLISQIAHLSKTINHWNSLIKNHTDSIEIYLKPCLQTSSDDCKAMLKDLQNCKIISKDLSEEENSLTLQLEKILEKQHSFMLSSVNEVPQEPDLSGILENITSLGSNIKQINRKLQIKDLEYSNIIANLDQEECIAKLQMENLNLSLKTVFLEQKKIEELELKIQKIDEIEEAPIPSCLKDRGLVQSMSKLAIPAIKTPEKRIKDSEYLMSSQSRTFQSKYSSDRPMFQSSKLSLPLHDDLSAHEKLLLEKIQPLLEGSEIYKRFSQRSSLKQVEFDPLDCKINPPEACGYGLRTFTLSKCCTRIDVKYQLRTGFDSTIPVDSILNIIIPQITKTVLKVQKRTGKDEIDTSDRKNSKNNYETMKERGYLDTKSKAFNERCVLCKWYPFSIALVEGGRIELIAKTYPLFKNWINGINCLLKNRKLIEKVRNCIS